MFAVMSLKDSLCVVVGGIPQEVPLTWAEGMAGAIAVFETEEAAKAYVKDTNVPILELRVHGGESDG